jgi:16S rRNA (guanine527-N7)-methyltransferase
LEDVSIITRYFPDLSEEQRDRFARLGELYAVWNERVNLISRKDIVFLYERHILHSLGIAKVILDDGSALASRAEAPRGGGAARTFSLSALVARTLRDERFQRSTDTFRVVDVGTGGGFPGVPLAIMFPQWNFHLIDGIGKKIMAVQGVIEGLGLTNATAEQVRSTDHKERYDLIVSRAVTTLPEFIRDTKHLVTKDQGRMLYLKGGELADEILPVRNPVRVHELRERFTEEFFETKKVVEVEM